MADEDWQMMNMATLRVAGVGGLGLVAMALIVASQYQMISGTLVWGAIGGAVGGTAVVLWRRRRGPLGSAGDRPGGRRFLVARKPTEPVSVARAGDARGPSALQRMPSRPR